MPAKKQITREMILTAALKILKEQGYNAVNVKQLSKELGCSTQPVYLSFSGMEDLRNALLPLAIEEFKAYMSKQSKDAIINLYDISYIYFAKEEPNLFSFLFMRSNAFLEIKQAIYPIVEQSIKSLINTYRIRYEEADILHDHLWMHTHGIASMIATNFCDWDIEKVGKMLLDCKRTFTKKYEVPNVYE